MTALAEPPSTVRFQYRNADAVLDISSRVSLVRLSRSRWTGENQLGCAKATIDQVELDARFIRPPATRLIPKDLNLPITTALNLFDAELQRYALPFAWCEALNLKAIPHAALSTIRARFEELQTQLDTAVSALIDQYPTRILEPARAYFVPVLGASEFQFEHGQAPTDADADLVRDLGERRFRREFQAGTNPILPSSGESLRSRFGVRLTEVPLQYSRVDPEELALAVDELVKAPRETLASTLRGLSSALNSDNPIRPTAFNASLGAIELVRNWTEMFDSGELSDISDLDARCSQFLRLGSSRGPDQSYGDVWPRAVRDELRDAINALVQRIERPESLQAARVQFRRRARVVE